MADNKNFRINPFRSVVDGLHPFGGIFKRESRLRTDRTFRRQPHVCNEDIRPGIRHLLCFGFVEGVRCGKHPHLTRCPNHFHLRPVPHVRLFKQLTERSVNQTDRREVLNSRKSDRIYLTQEDIHQTKGIRAANPGENGCIRDNR